MIDDVSIKRIVRRHCIFNRKEIDSDYVDLCVDIVKECININNMSKKEKDKRFKKFRLVNF